MYESPITKIVGDIAADIVKREEDCLMESVHKEGFDINKEELAKALRYDRDQYEKGFRDGRLSAEPKWIPVTERLPDDDSACFVTVKYRDIRYTDIAHCFASKDSSVRDWVGANDDDVLAWMPMPEPWKGEADG